MNKYLRLASTFLLVSTPAFADDVSDKSSPLALDIDAPKNIEAGKATSLEILIISNEGGELARADELVRMNGAAFYVIITDETFSDYHYLPVQGNGGQNAFSTTFIPKHNGKHYLWADITTLESGTPTLIPAILGKDEITQSTSVDFLESSAGDYRFKLKLDNKPSVNRPVTGIVSISRIDGTPLAASDAAIGEGTHVAGFYTNLTEMRNALLMRSTILEHPKKAKAIVPALAFHFTPERAGNMRVFVTFTLNGQLVHVPFGITVAPEQSGISLDDFRFDVEDVEIPDMPEMPDIKMPNFELPSFEDVNWERILP
ncbi:MAG: hypothetical protein ACK502_08555 [Alphaproteobacteria bacterium]